EPRQTVQGWSMITPAPRHCGHASENEKKPWSRATVPVPPQVGQGLGRLGGSAPDPPQCEQVVSPRTCRVVVTPRNASSNEMVRSARASAPRTGPADRRVLPAKMSPSPPSPPKRSLRSSTRTCWPPNLPNPPGPPADPPANPEETRRRTWSYSFRCFGSESTEYASETALNRSSASGSPGLASGWSFWASLR